MIRRDETKIKKLQVYNSVLANGKKTFLRESKPEFHFL
jgi:hypothetical protein